MQTFFTNLFDQSSFPLWSAFLLGIITSLGPCTMTTNVAAIGFISKKAPSKRRVLLGGLIYTLGRAFSYTSLALVLYFGANALRLSGPLSRYGEKLIGPLLLLIGLVMLDLIPMRFPTLTRLSEKLEQKKSRSYIHDFLLGAVFALAFCSYSGVMYFGLLIPMTITRASGLVLPLLFALGTGLVVILFAVLIAFAVAGLNRWFIGLKNIERWLRRGVAVLFIGLGFWKIVVLWLI
jgi:cytochrome c biogenesis protein CcdA